MCLVAFFTTTDCSLQWNKIACEQNTDLNWEVHQSVVERFWLHSLAGDNPHWLWLIKTTM